MDACDGFIRRIVSRAGFITTKARRDLERELRDHLEDALEQARSEGCDEASILRIVCDRFGDPDEIGRQFAVAHQLERRAIYIACSVAWLGVSTLTVACLVLTLQLLVAICSGVRPANAFPHLQEEIVGFASLSLGYMGLYFEQRLFQRRRLMKAFVMNVALFAFLFTLTFIVLHLTTLGPVLAFVAGLAVRVLRQSVARPAWILGTAAPIALACLSSGPLMSGTGSLPLWRTALVRWTGLSVACYSLTLLSRTHHAHSEL